MTNHQRILWVDSLRGFAIVLMIVFHFCYDLRYFGYVNWQVPNGANWWPFRYVILTLFIFTVGISLSLAHHKQFHAAAFVKRALQLLIVSLAITVMSLVMFPSSWIYFGILHFILAASFLGVVVVRKPWLALILGLVILLADWWGYLDSEWPFVGFGSVLPQNTEDFVPLFPWLGVMYLGIACAGLLPIQRFNLPRLQLIRPITWMGRHALLIYLIHQPIMFAGFMAVAWMRQSNIF